MRQGVVVPRGALRPCGSSRERGLTPFPGPHGARARELARAGGVEGRPMTTSFRRVLGLAATGGLALSLVTTAAQLRAPDTPATSDRIVASLDDGEPAPAVLAALPMTPASPEVIAVARVPDVAQREEVEDAGAAIDVAAQEERTASLRGRLVDDATDAPIAGAEIHVGVQRSHAARNFVPPNRLVTDAGGEFRADGLPPGAAWLSTRSSNRLAASVGPIVLASEECSDLGEIRLIQGGELRATLLGPDGERLGTVRAKHDLTRRAKPNVHGMHGSSLRWYLAADGLLLDSELAPGTWSVKYPIETDTGRDLRRTESPDGWTRWSITAPFEIVEGRVTEVVLGPPTFGRGVLVGRVTLDGSPVGGARVRVTTDQDNRSTGATLHLDREQPVDASGAFRFDAFPAGPALLTILIPADEAGASDSLRVEVPVTIPEDAEIRHDVALGQRASIRGRVKRKRDGRAVATARILARPEDSREPTIGTRADDHGRYVLAGLAPGRWWIAADARGLERGERGPIEVRNGGDQTVDLDLAFGGCIHVDVATPDGRRLLGATVEAVLHEPSAGSASTRFEGESSGTSGWCVSNLPAGRWVVSARMPGFPIVWSEPIDLAEGGAAGAHLVFAAGTPLRVVARDRDGAEVFPSAVELRGDRGRLLALADDDALRGDGGPGVVLCAPEGRGTLVVSAPGFRASRTEIGVGRAAGPPTEVTLER